MNTTSRRWARGASAAEGVVLFSTAALSPVNGASLVVSA
jgi:hypothetical protein